MDKQFNGLTPAEAERLFLLLEECGEVIQVVGKILRHGYESCDPSGGPTNRSSLEQELGDLMTALHLMEETKDINIDKIINYAEAKQLIIGEYLHHNEVPEG